jgi:hypothetical protein
MISNFRGVLLVFWVFLAIRYNAAAPALGGVPAPHSQISQPLLSFLVTRCGLVFLIIFLSLLVQDDFFRSYTKPIIDKVVAFVFLFKSL